MACMVRDFNLKRWVWAVLLLMPWIANAAGLGKITVLSALGQPFHAEIELISVGKGELSTLSANLASPDAYQQKNLQYNQALLGMRLTVEQRSGGGQAYIRLASSRTVNDPFADLLIELNTASGSIMREYVVLLDPPGYGAHASAIVSPPVAAAQSRPPVSSPVAAQKAPDTAPLAATKPAAAAQPPAGTQKYGPVRRGETLGKIARSLKPADISLEQMLAGLYRSNPDAFANNNMNLLKAGATLQVPDKQELMAVSKQEALKEYRVQVANWKNYRRNLADAARPSAGESKGAKRDKAGSASRSESVRVLDKADSGKAGKPVLRLSAGAPEAGKTSSTPERVRILEEEIVAQGKALDEANERIKRLEKALQNPAAASDRPK
ncbi:MAG: FimV/HubP family polar landmark protein [Pseudomonadota bacterium]